MTKHVVQLEKIWTWYNCCVKQLSFDDTEYSFNYLVDGRKILMAKIDRNRKNLEQAYAEYNYTSTENISAHLICHMPTKVGGYRI